LYNIETLAKLAGISRRAVRYYIQRGLLQAPEGQKRGSYYTEKHLERLQEIIKYAARGVPLIKMKEALDNNKFPEGNENFETPQGNIRREKFERVKLGNGIELQFKDNLLNQNELKKIKGVIEEIMKGKSNDN
jgi:DNA-binding transcriptional MerR regulator